MNLTVKHALFTALAITFTQTVWAGEHEVTATFAGGCFWCMEEAFDSVEGVTETTSGYANGHVKNPSYEDVTGGGTGHVEAVQITYDPDRVDYRQILEVYWANVDPLDDGGQFCDRGPSYQTGLFHHNEHQRQLALESKRRLAEGYDLGDDIVTPIEPLETFYPAEEYHQDYHRKNTIRYTFYVWNCGRHDRLEELWGDSEGKQLELFDSQ